MLTDPTGQDTWLRDAEVAKRLGIRKRRVHELRADYSGDFPAARSDGAGRPTWRSTEIEAWATAQQAHPTGINARPAPSLFQSWASAGHEHLRRLPAPMAALGVLAITGLLYLQRLEQHATNVDDYLYARQTDAILRSLTSDGTGIVDAWRLYAINSPLVPTLATPIAAFDRTPATLVLVQLPLLLGLWVAVAELARRTGLTGALRWPLAALVVVLPPVLTYSVMLNFSIAATLCTIGALAAYLASARLRSTPASACLGIALGLLALSRVVALVYLAAVVVPLVADTFLDRDDEVPRSRNAALAVVLALAIAGPWWLIAGPAAMRYLLDAGYSSDSVFTADTSPAHALLARLTHTADETGWMLSALLLLLFVVGALGAWRAWRRARADGGTDEPARAILLCSLVTVLGLLFLGTSSNAGTGFALPFVVLMAVVGAAGSAMLVRRHRLAVRAALTGVVAIGLVLTVVAVFLPDSPPVVDGRQLWLSGTPVRAQYEQALGCACPMPDANRLNEQIYQQIGGRRVLVLRDDAIVNPESLRFLGQVRRRPVDLTAPAGGDSVVDPALLDTVAFALSGRTAGPYHAVDLVSADAQLEAKGFRRVFVRRLSASNVVALWAAPSPSAR